MSTYLELNVPIFYTVVFFFMRLINVYRSIFTCSRIRINTSSLGKGVRQSCILSPCLFNLYAEYIMRNAGLDEAQAGIKFAERNINNLKYADDTTLMAESEEELRAS